MALVKPATKWANSGGKKKKQKTSPVSTADSGQLRWNFLTSPSKRSNNGGHLPPPGVQDAPFVRRPSSPLLTSCVVLLTDSTHSHVCGLIGAYAVEKFRYSISENIRTGSTLIACLLYWFCKIAVCIPVNMFTLFSLLY
ncbi:hypothetical protein DAI22_07g254900 [Oryza sativa Japonica Group]|nr:hypothetical protein DAI22_07g254900 [Oryza sativa Japonica Group]